MQSVEASAKTRKEAIQNALDELGVELHEVEIEILDEGSRGFLGLGARDVRVRVTAEGLPDRPKAEKQPQAEKQPKTGRRPKDTAQPKASERPATPKRKRAEEPKPTPVSETTAQEAAALLEEVIGLMGIEAKVTCASGDEGGLKLLVDSPDSALLIGRKGRNLTALQYLINRMFLSRDAADAAERLIVDVEGYQDRRKQALEDMAQQMARRAKETGREMRVKPLNPQERRVIHVALQDDPDVRTFSLGNSLLRTVVIAPKTGEKPTGGERSRRGGGQRRRSGGGRRDRASSAQHARRS